MKLPGAFIEKMSKLLGDELDQFLDSYENEKISGLRVNTLKITVEAFKELAPFDLVPVPWTKDGFYYAKDDNVTKSPLFHAGLYYIQEPSAMAPVFVLDPEPEDMVLDLCASPGGKSVQIASCLDEEEGLLVTNDISKNRIKALIRNVEIYGIKNAVILNEDQFAITNRMSHCFTKVLIDAPCSGEGMFRKDKNAVKSWGTHNTEVCSEKQKSIMGIIQEALVEGGRLVYSTCTFSREENEDILDEFLINNPTFEKGILPEEVGITIKDGYGRLWPHKVKGEGHFIGLVEEQCEVGAKKTYSEPTVAPETFLEFQRENLNIDIKGKFAIYGTKLYLQPNIDIDTTGLKVVRSGWLLGELKKGRFEPSPALAMGLKKEDVIRVIDLDFNSIEVRKYLKCETLHIEGEEGLNLVCVNGHPLGWAKLSGGVLKNKYPAAWRLM